jgi:hypothetical protein
MQRTESFFSHQTKPTGHISLEKGLRFWTACLVVCSLLTALSGGIGLLAIAITFTRIVPHSSWLSISGGISGAASILFLILSGHCMDKAEEADRAIKFQRWREEAVPMLSANGSPTDAALGYKSL